MGWAFVKRRMMAELGPDWEKKFASFEHQPAAAASLGQVHRARSLDGGNWRASCNIPTCSRRSKPICSSCNGCSPSAARLDSAIDTSEVGKEIGERVREELDYRREAKHVALYGADARGESISCACRGLAGAIDRAGCSPSIGSKAAAC